MNVDLDGTGYNRESTVLESNILEVIVAVPAVCEGEELVGNYVHSVFK
jgi:hypothetical protein